MGRHDILLAISVIVVSIIWFFFVIINIIIWMSLIISQKWIVFAFISATFLVLLPKLCCFLLFIIQILVRAITSFATNIKFFILWLITIIIIVIAIVSVVALIVLISTIMLPKLMISKILNIWSIIVIICHNRRLKPRRKLFKSCC